jgi:outer membrane protein
MIRRSPRLTTIPPRAHRPGGRMKTRLLAAALLVAVPLPLLAGQSPTTAAANPRGDPLPLDQAIQLALVHNRQLSTATLQVDKAGQALAIARTRRLPLVDVNFQAGQLLTPLDFTFPAGAFGTFANIGPVPAADTAISTPRRPAALLYATVGQPLSQLPRLNLGIRASELDQQAERERLRRARQSVIAQVKRLYYGILQAQSGLEATNESIALYRELHRVMAERLAQQVVLKGDGLEVELRLAQAEQTALTQQHAADTQQEQLNQLMGRDIATPFIAMRVPDAPGSQADLDALTRQAQDRNPEIREARLRVEHADVDRRATKAERIPEVNLVFTYLSPLNVQVVPNNIAAVSFQVHWQPLDWGKRGRDVVTKELAAQQVRLALQDAEARVALAVHAQMRHLDELRAQVRIASIGQDLARERLRVKTDQVKRSAVLPADVLQVQAQLADSGARYQQALLEFWTTRAELDQTLGEDVQP